MSGGADRRAIEDDLFARLLDPDTDEASRRQIRDELVQMHLPLVRHIARRYADRGEPLDDVVQVGTVGLIQAVVIPLIGEALHGTAFPTASHVFLWYVYGSHLLFALAGLPPGRDVVPASAPESFARHEP